jgi:hypothetical protein
MIMTRILCGYDDDNGCRVVVEIRNSDTNVLRVSKSAIDNIEDIQLIVQY